MHFLDKGTASKRDETLTHIAVRIRISLVTLTAATRARLESTYEYD